MAKKAVKKTRKVGRPAGPKMMLAAGKADVIENRAFKVLLDATQTAEGSAKAASVAKRAIAVSKAFAAIAGVN
jgi:hypothetical protein